ncbi:ATP-binding cassette sub-family D member 3-like isoform X3 [Artemia franciscana]|uniref:ATP-binding cassette sub-family D member 3-like isoform X3 n=1 Tax=Artemia franciscana TaxID=6661 RepID=UPI0032D9E371
MGSLSKLLKKQDALLVIGAAASVCSWILLSRSSKKSRQKMKEMQYVINQKQSGGSEKIRLDGRFFAQLKHLLGVVIPSPFSCEFGFLVLVAATLVSRSMCDIWIIQNSTAIESAIIGANYELFRKNLGRFLTAMPIMSVVNNLLKYGLDELKLRFRTRLTNYLYEQYFKGFTYYKINNLDNRIANPDQLLTADVDKFCSSVADLYSNISKPLLDIVIYVQRLTAAIGAQGPGLMILYLIMSGMFLTYLRRPAGKLTAAEQKLEGEFRYVNSRVITNSEEIAFYQGNIKEKLTTLSAFDKLVDHLRKFLQFRFSMGFIDNVVAKYLAIVIGFTVVCRPFLDKMNPLARKSHSERLEDYYKSGRMLVKLAEAIGRLVLAGREMTRLAGYTARVTELSQVLKELNAGKYQRTMVSDATDVAGNKISRKIPLIPGSGKMITQDRIIKFEHVPLVTPNGDVLIEDMSFEVHSGMNVLVCGPNGCGKSSLFRILGELWPIFGGTLTKPEKGKLFYIPQRPYMTLGTLRDQIIYPHTESLMRHCGKKDADLIHFLNCVELGYIAEREGGLDAVADWMDVLSGGEKQRIAMARLFYHCPQFAILDECTSAVSVDVEGKLYAYCRDVGITLFTVSHRKSLWVHHEFCLHMDGRGSYEFKKIDGDTIEFGS